MSSFTPQLRRGFEFACIAMASEGATSLAPPQGVAADGADGASSESDSEPPPREVTVTLRWPSGAVIGEFTEWDGIEYYMAHEIDYSHDVPWPGLYYELYWGTTRLHEGKWFRNYGMEDGAEVTLLLRRCDEARRPR